MDMIIKHMMKEYIELINKAELRRAISLKFDAIAAARLQEEKIICYSGFITRLNEISNNKYTITLEITTDKCLDTEISYYKRTLQE